MWTKLFSADTGLCGLQWYLRHHPGPDAGDGAQVRLQIKARNVSHVQYPQSQ